jgi:hypothetical protein
MSGLPDGIFSDQKSQFGQILEGLRIENVGICYGHWAYFTAIWCILWQFGKVVVIWHIFPHFGICTYCIKKNLAPLLYVVRSNGFA